MHPRSGKLITAVLVAAVACAATMEERRDYILAHPHGWIEFSIEDLAVPLVPFSEEEPDLLRRPDSCSVEVLLDREPFVYGHAYPVSDEPPYSVRIGFRFAAPVGTALFSVTYSGCDVDGGRASQMTAQLPIAVEEARVVEVHFDGTNLFADPPRDDSVVTLDDIYEAVTGRKKSAP